MKKRELGHSGLAVGTLGFGCASLGNLYHAISDATVQQTLDAAINSGFRYFDTAPYYGFGLSERRLGDALRSLPREAFVLSTKVGRLIKPAPQANVKAVRRGFATPMPFEPIYDYTYDGIMRSYEDSLQRLGLASIDVLLVHDIGIDTHRDHDAHYFEQLQDSGFKALDELRTQGDIKAVGLGVNETAVCERVMDIGQFDCFLLAGRYSLLEQQALDSFLPKCERHGATVIIGGPYNSGILATGVSGTATPLYNYEPAPQNIIDHVSRLEGVCADFGVTLAAAALQFPLAHPSIASVIPGLGSAQRVEKTLAIFNENIPADFWQALKQQGLLREAAPIPKENQ